MSCGMPGENIPDKRGSLSGVERSKEHGSEKGNIGICQRERVGA